MRPLGCTRRSLCALALLLAPATASAQTATIHRDAWGVPTVLIGSAGLNLAAAWEVRGGYG